MKKYANAAIVYSFLALAGGVFYREFTKFSGFEGATSLGVRPSALPHAGRLLLFGVDRLR